jgi:hypothetical protein
MNIFLSFFAKQNAYLSKKQQILHELNIIYIVNTQGYNKTITMDMMSAFNILFYRKHPGCFIELLYVCLS